jgi:chaperone modulatory protein CbpM
MTAFEDLLHRLKGLDRRELTRWVENRWVLPERHNDSWVFHEVDVARVELILEIRREFAIDDEALPLVLGLLDQVYELRRQLRRMCDALTAQPPEVQAVIRRSTTRLTCSPVTPTKERIKNRGGGRLAFVQPNFDFFRRLLRPDDEEQFPTRFETALGRRVRWPRRSAGRG